MTNSRGRSFENPLQIHDKIENEKEGATLREISEKFFTELKSGFLVDIAKSVIADTDLNLEIRDHYINIYYKGNSLLKLAETSTGYRAEIHEKFSQGLDIPKVFNKGNIDIFIKAIPQLKQNIILNSKRSLEVEYEQMIIRANNFEPRNNTEYFIVDRQYAVKEGRFDLTGMFWNRQHRAKYQEVPVCLMEIKFALNSDISEVHDQLTRYYEAIHPKAAEIAAEMQAVFPQKLDLGLYHQSEDRIAALKTLTFSPKIEQFQFILILVDYNPNSSKLDLESIRNLPFANQIKVFYSGFGMWQQNVKPLIN
jgi:hypothetical protein